jgi:hypothetical protein
LQTNLTIRLFLHQSIYFMTETIAQPSQEVTTQVEPSVADMMSLALGGFNPNAPQTNNEPAAVVTEPTVQTTTAPATTEAAVVETVVPVFQFDTLKEKFGYQTPDEALADIEALRALKNTPTPLAFENETSKAIFEALQSGKVEEVKKYLVEQDRLQSLTTTEVNENTAAEIIKLGMQLKNKDLTPQEVDFLYNKQYALPKQPTQGMDELDEDFTVRLDEWKSNVQDVQMNKMIQAKMIRPELEASKSKLVLPKAEQPQDERYNQYLKMLEDSEASSIAAAEAYKAFTPKTISEKITFNDEVNKVAVDFEYEPDSESFNEAVAMASDLDKFFAKFTKPDGTPDREAFFKTIYYGLNHQKVVTEAMKQTKNATIVAKLPDNIGDGTRRGMPEHHELTELQSNMDKALHGYR